MPSDISLRGLINYATTKNGISITPQYRHLRDLESLVNNMYDIRNGRTTAGCLSHGNELDTRFTSSYTLCSGHSGTAHDPNDLSLGKFNSEFENMKSCSCDSYRYVACTCESRCECDSRCSCDCDHCSCDCDHCSCDNDYY